jgi:predicted nucleotidyltransferase
MTCYGRVDIQDADLAALCRRYEVRELSLLGSALTDAFGPDSDVDLLVDFEPGAKVGFLRLAALQRELSELIGRPVDLALKRSLKPLIRENILTSARTLYAA